MRRIFFLVLALVVALLGCTVVLLFRPSLWPEAAARIGATTAEAPRAAERRSPFTTPDAKQVGPKRPLLLSAFESRREPEPAAFRSATSEPVKYPFPMGTEINVGTLKSEVLASFGPPDILVTGADLGRLHERIIYVDRSTHKKTVIAVVNGKVATAETYIGDGSTQE
jgi:hypothetical protein